MCLDRVAQVESNGIGLCWVEKVGHTSDRWVVGLSISEGGWSFSIHSILISCPSNLGVHSIHLNYHKVEQADKYILRDNTITRFVT